MRNVKFRAWSREVGEYVAIDNGHQMIFSRGGEFHGFSYGGGHFVGRGYFEIEQFTGLMDSSHREIYEGDIVLYDRWAKRVGVVCFDCFSPGDECGEEVIGWYVERPPSPLGSIAEKVVLRYGHRFTIVGNVHENTDLLKETA